MGEGSLSLTTLLALGAVALLPVFLVAATSFAKMAVVFSVLRNALGAPDVPSAAIVTALAMILSGYVMAPVANEIAAAASSPAARIDLRDPLGPRSRGALFETLEAGSRPLVGFLTRNAGGPERQLFVDLGKRTQPGNVAPSQPGLSVALPAFLITELKEAFQIGLLVLLPFVVLDLVVASVLGAVGMSLLPPSVLALPFKLLLFVLIDGWVVLSQALVTGYR
jgi:type III secretion protein R